MVLWLDIVPESIFLHPLSIKKFSFCFICFRKNFRASDTSNDSQVGDIVVINELPRPDGHLITHRVSEVLYRNGMTVDPITGKTVHSIYYSDQVANRSLEHYTSSQSADPTETAV